jgi:hypothetical protein
MQRVGVGRKASKPGVLLYHDLATNALHVEAGPGLERTLPPAFVERLAARHAGRRLRASGVDEALTSSVMLLLHRLRESNLGRDYRLLPTALDSVRVRVDSVTAVAFVADAQLDVGAPVDSTLERAFPAGASPHDAVERHREWLALPVYAPNAEFLTKASRQYLARGMTMTSAQWEYYRVAYAGAEREIEVRGQLAIAYAVDDALAPPVFLRRTAEGWQVDLIAPQVVLEEPMGMAFAWGIYRDGSEWDTRFADMYIGYGFVWRFRDGANQRLRDAR